MKNYREIFDPKYENKEEKELPHFSDELVFKNGNKIVLEHENFSKIDKLSLINQKGQCIDLTTELPLPDDIGFRIGNDFGFINDRRKGWKILEIPAIKNFREFSEQTPNEYLLLIFHEYAHATGRQQEKISEEYNAFFESLSDKINLSEDEKKRAVDFERRLELDAWQEAIKKIKEVEQKYKIAILPAEEDLKQELAAILMGHHNKWAEQAQKSTPSNKNIQSIIEKLIQESSTEKQ